MSINVAYVGPGQNGNVLSLVILDNTKGVEALNVASLPGLSLQMGPSMCQGDTNLHIFVTDFNDHSIHEIVYNTSANTFTDVGTVTGASTADRTAAVFDPNTQTMSLFFQDSHVLKQAVRTTGGSWNVSPVNGAQHCDWGPAACTRGGAINLAYTSYNSLKVGWLENGQLQDLTPNPNVSIWWGPALINYQSVLFAIFGWQDTNNLNYMTNNTNVVWSGSSEINSYNCVDQGPSACVFNNEIFCFSQASGNRLIYTVYALGSWPNDNPGTGTNFTSVKYNGKEIDNVYWAPAAVAII